MVYGLIAALVEMPPTRIRYTSMLPHHIGNGWFGGLMPATAFAMIAHSGRCVLRAVVYPDRDRRLRCHRLLRAGEQGQRHRPSRRPVRAITAWRSPAPGKQFPGVFIGLPAFLGVHVPQFARHDGAALLADVAQHVRVELPPAPRARPAAPSPSPRRRPARDGDRRESRMWRTSEYSLCIGYA